MSEDSVFLIVGNVYRFETLGDELDNLMVRVASIIEDDRVLLETLRPEDGHLLPDWARTLQGQRDHGLIPLSAIEQLALEAE